MMDQIYSRAHKVHVWLGEAEPSDRIEWVFNFFGELAVGSHDDSMILKWRIDKGGPWERDVEKTIDRFLARPWFGRRWILQEVALAFDVIVRCGQFKMPWQWLARGSRMLNSYRLAQKSFGISSRRVVETITFLSTPSNQLLALIFEFHASECSVLADRLFGLYGMANGPKDPPVNYDSPWTDIYCSFARACVKQKFPEPFATCERFWLAL